MTFIPVQPYLHQNLLDRLLAVSCRFLALPMFIFLESTFYIMFSSYLSSFFVIICRSNLLLTNFFKTSSLLKDLFVEFFASISRNKYMLILFSFPSLKILLIIYCHIGAYILQYQCNTLICLYRDFPVN